MVLEVSGHKQLLEHNPTLRRLIQMRNPYIDPIHHLQVRLCAVTGAGNDRERRDGCP